MLFDRLHSIDRLNLVDNQHLGQKQMDLAIVFLFLRISKKTHRDFSLENSIPPESNGRNRRWLVWISNERFSSVIITSSKHEWPINDNCKYFWGNLNDETSISFTTSISTQMSDVCNRLLDDKQKRKNRQMMTSFSIRLNSTIELEIFCSRCKNTRSSLQQKKGK